MNIKESFHSKYIKVSELKGKAVLVTIAGVNIEEVGEGNDKEEKPVLYFEGPEKGMVLNKTNAGTIAAGFGDETDDWKNKEIEVYPDTTLYKGDTVACIRVRIPVAPAATDGSAKSVF